MVLTVSAEAPEPFANELGLNEHTGARATAGVMLLQDRLAVPLKRFMGVIVIVEVADPPAETVAGESGEAATAKSAGGGIGLTIKLIPVA
jgi:hypothetical protein